MSLRLRLLLTVGAVALVALAVADVVTYRSLKSFLYDQVDQSLESAHGGLEHRGGGGGPGGPRGPDDSPGDRGPRPDEPTAGAAPGTFVQVRDGAGRVVSSVPAYLPGGTAVTPELPARIGGLESGHAGEPTRYLTAPATEADGPEFRVRVGQFADGGQLILGLPLTNTAATLHRLLLIELVVTGLALAAATGLGWWLVRVGLRPLGEVKRTAAAIAAGQLDRRVPGEDAHTEVGEVARALNTMLGRIEGAFAERDATEAELRRSEERLRRFVADASHELRTPLAAVTAYAEMSDRVARDHPEDLDRVMGGIRSESARMGHMVEDLLLLAASTRVSLSSAGPWSWWRSWPTPPLRPGPSARRGRWSFGPRCRSRWWATPSDCARSSTTSSPMSGPTRPRAPPRVSPSARTPARRSGTQPARCWSRWPTTGPD